MNSYKHGYYGLVVFLFSFHLIIIFILRSLLTGMLWEVFIIVHGPKDIEEELKEEIEEEEIKRKSRVSLSNLAKEIGKKKSETRRI